MKGDSLPDDANVVHYVSSSRITEHGEASWEAFRQKKRGRAPSVHWLQELGGTKEHQLARTRQVSRISLRRSGRFAELQVGEVRVQCADLAFVHAPLDATGEYLADPSHADMEVPERDSDDERIVCEQIASCVNAMHKAVQE